MTVSRLRVASTDNEEMTAEPDVDEQARQDALAELEILDTPSEERFDRVTRLCTRLFGVPMALVTLLDAERQWFKSKQGLDVEQIPRRDSFCNLTLQQPDVVVIEDAHLDERFTDNPLVTGNPFIRFYAGHPLETKSGHRVGTLCILDNKPRMLSAQERDLLRDLALWVQKELVIDEELARAADVQQGLLPKSVPDVPGYDLAGTVVSSWTVGGDFFDWYRVPGGLTITLADVMGKGMGGAILMATVRAVLRGTSAHPSVSAGITQASLVLTEDLQQTASFFTLFHARLDEASGTVTYVDAGHGLAAVVRARGGHERPRTRGLPVGILPDTTWEEDTVHLEPSDTLVVFSDGVLDMLGGADTEAEVERVIGEVAAMVRDVPTAEEAMAAVTANALGQPDDVTVLVVRRTR